LRGQAHGVALGASASCTGTAWLELHPLRPGEASLLRGDGLASPRCRVPQPMFHQIGRRRGPRQVGPRHRPHWHNRYKPYL